MVALALVGPTASGKSALALELARHRPGLELVSVDSMQVYRGMDLGTAKPSPAEQAEVRHHLIDLVEPSEEYTVSRYSVDLAAALADIAGRGRRAVLVGGTGLYMRAALGDLEIPPRYPAVRAQLEIEADPAVLHRRLEQLDPVAAARMEPTNRRRVVRALEVTLGSGRAFSSFGPGLGTYPPLDHPMVGLELDREDLDRRIEQRYQAQLAAGFLQEVATLAARDRADVALRRPGAGLPRAAGPPGRGGEPGGGRGAGRAPHPALRAPPGAVVSARSPHRLGRGRAQCTR